MSKKRRKAKRRELPVKGDIFVGSIADSKGIAIGHGATSGSIEAGDWDRLKEMFRDYRKMVEGSELCGREKAAVSLKVDALEQELVKPDPNPGRLARIAKFLVRKGGDVARMAKAVLRHPIVVKMAGDAVGKLLED